MPEIKQKEFEYKLSLYLTTLGEKDLSAVSNIGICNSFAFRNFLDAMINLSGKNKMQSIMEMDNKFIIRLARLYREYKEARSILLVKQQEADEISKLNVDINVIYHQLQILRSERKDSDKKNDQEILFENQIRELRTKREILIDLTLKVYFGHKKFTNMQRSQEIYFYIQSLIAAYNPGGQYKLRVNGKYVHQKDFIQILELIPPDALLPKELKEESETQKQIPLAQKMFEIAFTFTKEELASLLSDETIIREGDYIRLATSNHVVFISYKNSQFELFDPGPVEMKPNTPEILATTIKNRLFKDKYSEFMPIGMSIFKKTALEEEKIARPTAINVIKDILSKRKDININAKTWDHTTAAWMSANYGQCDVLKLLIDEKADLNIANIRGSTIASIAIQNDHLDVLQVLHESKMDVNITDKSGCTPIWIAARYGHIDILKHLIELKGNIHQNAKDGSTPLFIAAQNDNIEAVQLLIEKKTDLNKSMNNGLSPLCIAVQKENIELVKILLNEKADINQSMNMETPLMMAAQSGLTNITKLLLERIDINFNADTIKNIQILKEIAEKNNRQSELNLLFKNKRLTKNTLSGFSALHAAAFYGHIECVKALLQAGVNRIVTTEMNITALELARAMGHTAIVDILKNPELKQELKDHEIKDSISYDKTQSFINKQDSDLLTPLHWAIKKMNFVTVKTLLDEGADLEMKDKFGKKPADYGSSEMKSFIILQQLKKYINHHWEAKPEIVNKQLQRINTANQRNDWSATLQAVIDIASEKPGFFASFFSSTPTTDKDLDNYLRWFSSPEKLEEELIKVTPDNHQSFRFD